MRRRVHSPSTGTHAPFGEPHLELELDILNDRCIWRCVCSPDIQCISKQLLVRLKCNSGGSKVRSWHYLIRVVPTKSIEQPLRKHSQNILDTRWTCAPCRADFSIGFLRWSFIGRQVVWLFCFSFLWAVWYFLFSHPFHPLNFSLDFGGRGCPRSIGE